MKEHRSAAKKRFDVAIYLVRKEFFELTKQTGLAARPFQKRLGFNPIRHDKRHGQLFVVEFAVAFKFVQWRSRSLAVDFVAGFQIGSLIQPLPRGGSG